MECLDLSYCTTSFYYLDYLVPGPDRDFLTHKGMLKKINACSAYGPLHFKLRVGGMSEKIIYHMNSRDEDYRVPIWETGKQRVCYKIRIWFLVCGFVYYSISFPKGAANTEKFNVAKKNFINQLYAKTGLRIGKYDMI